MRNVSLETENHLYQDQAVPEDWIAFHSNSEWFITTQKKTKKTSPPKRHLATQLVNANWLWLVMSNDMPLSPSLCSVVPGWWIFLLNPFSRCADYPFHNYYCLKTEQRTLRRSFVGLVVLSRFCGAEAVDVHSSLRSSTVDPGSIQTQLRINLSQCQTVWRLERGKCF